MANQNDDIIAQTFKQLLIKCNTNAYRIAKETGIDKTYLSKLSSGIIAKPGQDKIIKIAKVLNIKPEQLATVFYNPTDAIQEFGLEKIDAKQSIVDRRHDWGSAPDGIICYDRQAEVNQLKEWINVKGCRLVNLFGLGGIGKTTLAIEVAKQIESEFDYVFWRNLGNISLIEVIVQDALNLLDSNRKTRQNREKTISQQITTLLDHLRNHRCLFVLDEVETVLATGNSLQSYQNGYEVYGELLALP